MFYRVYISAVIWPLWYALPPGMMAGGYRGDEISGLPTCDLDRLVLEPFHGFLVLRRRLATRFLS